LEDRRYISKAQRELVELAPIASQQGRLLTFLHAFEFLPTGNVTEMLTFWWPLLHSVIHIYFIMGEGNDNKLGGKRIALQCSLRSISVSLLLKNIVFILEEETLSLE